jgi:putative transport protein
MVQLLIDNPLLLLFTVAALGYIIGEIKIKGSSLGVAAVLFAGLAVGALDPNLRLPELVTSLGLVLFVYTIGLSSGAGFFSSFRSKGLRDNLLVASLLFMATGVAAGLSLLLDLSPALTAGLFAGSLTNTATLAGVLEHIQTAYPDGANALLDEPVVGYSIAYPMGIFGVIIALALAQRWWHVDYAREAETLRDHRASGRKLDHRTIRVTAPDAARQTVEEMIRRHEWDIVFGRMRRDGQGYMLTQATTRFQPGDLVVAVGSTEELTELTALLGEVSDEQLELDRSEYDFRRIFVSNPVVAGHTLAELNLQQQYGAIVTRIRRGDVEWLAHGDTSLELGDRVRVVAKPENLPAVGKFLGDSYKALSEINVFSFSLGLLLGLLLGLVPVPLPGGITFRLGFAGGPLIMGLILGRLGRTGPIVWHLPYSGNMLLRQIGLVLFFAAVGTRAGYAFFETLTSAGGITIFAAGASITCATVFTALWVGHRLFKIPMSMLSGMVAGLHTQPAVLGFALQQSNNELPNVGYTTVFPIATMLKIVLAQVLFMLLS